MEIWDEDNNCPTPLLEHFIYDKEDGRIEYFKEKFGEYISFPYEIVATNGFRKYGIESLRASIFNL